QAPRTPHLDLTGAEIGVLPRYPVVLLVHADGVRDGHRIAVGVVDGAVEVVDLTEAVTAEGQRVGREAHPDLTHVEDVLVPVCRRRVTVGHNHFRQRSAVHDGPDGAAVVVGDLVQHQTPARVESDAQ